MVAPQVATLETQCQHRSRHINLEENPTDGARATKESQDSCRAALKGSTDGGNASTNVTMYNTQNELCGSDNSVRCMACRQGTRGCSESDYTTHKLHTKRRIYGDTWKLQSPPAATGVTLYPHVHYDAKPSRASRTHAGTAGGLRGCRQRVHWQTCWSAKNT